MNKNNQLHILKIFSDNNINMTENSNGVFINLIYVDPTILKLVNDYSYSHEKISKLGSSLSKSFFLKLKILP